jgi:hypothetical protein
VPSLWDQFEKPARDFLEAAAGHDSGRLRELVVSPAAVASILRNVTQNPMSFRPVGPLVLMKGRRAGDTTYVVFLNQGCRNHMVTFTFVGSGAGIRIRDFTPPCSSR